MSRSWRVGLEEFDGVGLGVEAVGEKDGVDFLAAVDGDEEFGFADGEGARFAEIHYFVADLADAEQLASDTEM